MKQKKSKRMKVLALWGKVKNFFRKIGTLNIVLICVGLYMVYINYQMLRVFQNNGSAPETAWCALIAALLGECGICGWIKTNKDRNEKYKKESDEKNESEE